MFTIFLKVSDVNFYMDIVENLLVDLREKIKTKLCETGQAKPEKGMRKKYC